MSRIFRSGIRGLIFALSAGSRFVFAQPAAPDASTINPAVDQAGQRYITRSTLGIRELRSSLSISS